MPPFDPSRFLTVVHRGSALMLDAQMVVTMRLFGMVGLWPVRPDESRRMIAEKGPALMRAASLAQSAALAGKRPEDIVLAGMAPLTRKARSNRKRLAQRRG